MQPSYTEQYFKDECVRFMKMCGDKTFWQLGQKQRDGALSGLAFVYINLDKNANAELCATFFETASDNYQRRELAMAFYNKRDISPA